MESESSELADIIKANINYHTALADGYNEKQPYFRRENVERVEAIIADLASRSGGGCLLDLGCGTGFIINIAKKYFKRIIGVDITPAMLKQVDLSDGNIELFEASSENLPVGDEEVDVCTGYSFLHHLYNLPATFKEIYRCLRPHGLFYFDQEPNYYYWWLMNSLEQEPELNDMVKREINSVVHDVEEVVADTGLPPDVVRMAEYQMKKGGFKADQIVALFQDAGFQNLRYKYEWYLGQGVVMRNRGVAQALTIEGFLRDSLPATRHLFKYLSFYGEK